MRPEREAGPDRLEIVCSEWSREDLVLILATLKSVRTGRIEISLRENRVVGVERRPFSGDGARRARSFANA